MEITSRFQQVSDRLKKQSDHTDFDPTEIQNLMQTMNDEMEKVRRDYQIKEKESQVTAGTIILTW